MKFKYKNYETQNYSENIFCNNEPCGGDHYLKIGMVARQGYSEITFNLNSNECCNIIAEKWTFDNCKEGLEVYAALNKQLKNITIAIDLNIPDTSLN